MSAFNLFRTTQKTFFVLFPKHLVWSERALFFLEISEIKFLGKYNPER